jgi:small subunit ribosomal protein S20
MPNKQNAKKALRQSEKRAARNLIVKNAYKTAVKTVKKAVVAGKAEITEELRLAQKTLAKAAKRGVIKKNTAARKLSRLAKTVQKAIKK